MNMTLIKFLNPVIFGVNCRTVGHLIYKNFYGSRAVSTSVLSSKLHSLSALTPRSLPKHFKNNARYSSSGGESEKGDQSAVSDGGTSDTGSAETVDMTGLDDCTLSLTPEEVEHLTKGDPELIKKIRYIQLEHEVLRQEGVEVPTKPIKVHRWEELLNLSSRNRRRKFFLFLFKLEKTKENDAKRKEEKKRKREEFLQSLPELPPLGEDPDGMIYGLNRNTLFLRLREETEFAFYHNRLILAKKFGQPLVYDCGYGEHMNPRETKNCAKQLELVFHCNRVHDDPFDLHFCNVTPNDTMDKYLKKLIPRLYDDDYPLNVTSSSYLDIFPRNKLVYLTPHAKDDLVEFDRDAVYIVGAMVDKTDPRPFSLAKAKKENLPMKKLPLDLYLEWGIGNKSLTLDQMINILLDIKYYKDWHRALSHIPRRKLRNFGKTDEEDFNYQIRAGRGVRGKIDPPTYLHRPQGKSNEFNVSGFRNPKSTSTRRDPICDLECDDEEEDLSGFRNPHFKKRASNASKGSVSQTNSNQSQSSQMSKNRIRSLMEE